MNQDLDKIIKSALRAHGHETLIAKPESYAYWDASFFQVQNSSLYQGMSKSQQQSFLTKMSDHLLKEACAIETAGLTYAARMNMLSKSVDEKVIYSLIGAEEALHLKSLEPFLAPNTAKNETPYFAGLIKQWIDTLERPSLLVMIQILLEGWGLKYYHSLAQGSTNSDLKSVFGQILLDEARHHATGVVLYRQEYLSASERSVLEEQLATLFNCVKVGPQQAVTELALHSSEKNIDFASLLTGMNAVEDSNSKLHRLQKLLEKTFDEKLIESCHKRGLFTACSIEEMSMMAEAQVQSILKSSAPGQGLPAELSL